MADLRHRQPMASQKAILILKTLCKEDVGLLCMDVTLA
jgi:hypothetical protein